MRLPRWLQAWLDGDPPRADGATVPAKVRPPRYAPRAERLSPDGLREIDARIDRLDFRVRELEREQRLERRRFGGD